MSWGRNFQAEGSAKLRPEVRASSASLRDRTALPKSVPRELKGRVGPGTCIPNQPHPGNKLLAGEGARKRVPADGIGSIR